MNSIHMLPQEYLNDLEWRNDYFMMNDTNKTCYFLSQEYITIARVTAESIKEYLTANQEEYLIFCDEK